MSEGKVDLLKLAEEQAAKGKPYKPAPEPRADVTYTITISSTEKSLPLREIQQMLAALTGGKNHE